MDWAGNEKRQRPFQFLQTHTNTMKLFTTHSLKLRMELDMEREKAF